MRRIASLTSLSPAVSFMPRLRAKRNLHCVRVREREATLPCEAWFFYCRQRVRDVSGRLLQRSPARWRNDAGRACAGIARSGPRCRSASSPVPRCLPTASHGRNLGTRGIHLCFRRPRPAKRSGSCSGFCQVVPRRRLRLRTLGGSSRTATEPARRANSIGPLVTARWPAARMTKANIYCMMLFEMPFPFIWEQHLQERGCRR
jgi:hypothetical protein